MFKKYFNSLNTNKKIFVFALLAAFLAQIFTGILACASILKCSYSVHTQADELGILTKGNTEASLRNQSKNILSETANQISENAELILKQTESQVESLSYFAENIYSISAEKIEIGANNNQMLGYVIEESGNSESGENLLVYDSENLPQNSIFKTNASDWNELPENKRSEIINNKIAVSENKTPENLQKEFVALRPVSNTLGNIYAKGEEISGMYIATESGIVYKSNSETGPKTMDFRKSSWYKKTKESAKNGQKSGGWSILEPVSESGTSHIVFSKAFFDAGGKFKGVIATDLYADKICNKITGAANYDDKYVFVFDNDASKVISSHNDSDIFFRGFDDPTESYDNLILSLKNSEYGTCDVLTDNEEYLTAYAPVKNINWSVGVAEKPKFIDSESQNIKENLISGIEDSRKKSGSDTLNIIFQFLIIFCSFGVVMYAFCRGLSKKIFSDMESIENDAKKFRKLSAELEMAEKIQKSMLPESNPTNFKRDDMEIYASSVSAEKVGGDFYDFFFIDENHIALVIADASDKGVPAAMYMSAAKNLIKNKLKSTGLLSKSLESVNDSLYEDNSMRMFVTAFVGILDTKSGKFEFINAGHTPPLLYSYQKDRFDFLSGPHNCALGGIKGKNYAVGSVNILKNDVLLLYTDGVTETTNAEKKLFSQERLKQTVNNSDVKHLPIEALIETIRNEIKNYSGEGGYSDDITLLGFRNLAN